ncbi:MAG: patatin-like phospholipase family protein [Deltaproteobacteria bacterium]|nr:patatin-like phospholipase family protein [Deltaproteobacteria bacterium]
MRRRPQEEHKPSISVHQPALQQRDTNIGIVMSGGGARAAYQVGALKALIPFLTDKTQKVSNIIGSSIGAVNGLVLAACLKNGLSDAVQQMEVVWRERSFRNTFSGSPSRAFLRAIRLVIHQYSSPGPKASSTAIFDPSPLMERIDGVIESNGGLHPDNRAPSLDAVAVMTTIEGAERKPLLFVSAHKRLDTSTLDGASFDVCYVDSLSAKHGFASAALPSVLPPVELDTEAGKVRLVDGGISQNVPVDPAVRFGAERVIVIDISGRNWWLDRYGEAHDTRPKWEVPAAFKTFCLRPPETFVARNKGAMGAILKHAVGSSTSRFIKAVGPLWPIFSILRKKMGEEVAYEVISYVALDSEYVHGLIEAGYNETVSTLRNMKQLQFTRSETFQTWAESL